MVEMPEEMVWKEIPNWPGQYVSESGWFKRLDGKITRGRLDKNGYLFVDLQFPGATSPKTVLTHPYRMHRLMMHTFDPLGKREKAMEVNHKDGNRTNNQLSNLEWCRPFENKDHAARRKLHKRRLQQLLRERTKIDEETKQIMIDLISDSEEEWPQLTQSAVDPPSLYKNKNKEKENEGSI